MRLWFLSLGAVLAFSVCGYMLAQYAVSFYEDIARWLGATPSIEFVKGVVADLQSKDFAAVEGKSERSIVNEQSRSVLAAIGSQLSSSPPKSNRLAAVSINFGRSKDAKTVRHTMLSLEYGIDGKWFLVNARVHQ